MQLVLAEAGSQGGHGHHVYSHFVCICICTSLSYLRFAAPDANSVILSLKDWNSRPLHLEVYH